MELSGLPEFVKANYVFVTWKDNSNSAFNTGLY